MQGSSLRAQRLVVLAALLAFAVAASVLSPAVETAGATTFATVDNSGYTPFPCTDPTNPSAAIGRRQTMPLYNSSRTLGSKTSDSATDPGVMYPCLSGTEWHISFGKVNDSTQRGSVNQVAVQSSSSVGTLNWAGSGSTNSLYHISFSDFTVTNPTASSGSLVNLATVPHTPDASSSPYTLAFAPAGAITIGGSGVYTDMWVTGDSHFGARGCVIIICTYVNITISGYTSVSWLLSSNNFPLSGVDLYFYYLVTHKNNAGNPYAPANAPSGTSINLPNTSVTVTPS